MSDRGRKSRIVDATRCKLAASSERGAYNENTLYVTISTCNHAKMQAPRRGNTLSGLELRIWDFGMKFTPKNGKKLFL